MDKESIAYLGTYINVTKESKRKSKSMQKDMKSKQVSVHGIRIGKTFAPIGVPCIIPGRRQENYYTAEKVSS